MGWYNLESNSHVEPIRNKWSGKKLMVFGDSNSDNSGVTVWHEHLKEELNLTVYKYARGGAGYIAKGAHDNIPNIIEQIANSAEDPDLIIIFAGGNDYSFSSAPLGTITDTNMSTFYGGLHNAYQDVIDKYPTKTIMVIAQTRRRSEGENEVGVTVKDQVDATINMAGKFSLPLLDMYHQGGVFAWNAQYREDFQYDGIHLTTEGHIRLKDKIKSFINTL